MLKRPKIYFEIHRALLEIPAKLPGQFGHSGQIFLRWAAATLKGLGEFQIKSLDHFLPSSLSKNGNFKTRDFRPLIKRVLAGVCWSWITLLKYLGMNSTFYLICYVVLQSQSS